VNGEPSQYIHGSSAAELHRLSLLNRILNKAYLQGLHLESGRAVGAEGRVLRTKPRISATD
jgi:hypothetical protein